MICEKPIKVIYTQIVRQEDYHFLFSSDWWVKYLQKINEKHVKKLNEKLNNTTQLQSQDHVVRTIIEIIK